MRITFIFVFLLVLFDVSGKIPLPDLKNVPSKHSAFIKKYWNAFIEERELHGVPASVSLAQAILESDAGTSNMVKLTNNFFGIKYRNNDLNNKYCSGKHKFSEGYFSKYKSPWWSIRHHTMLLRSKRYASIRDKYGLNYKAWAYQLKNRGYAEDRYYPQKLIKLIDTYKLYKADGFKNPVKNPDIKL